MKMKNEKKGLILAMTAIIVAAVMLLGLPLLTRLSAQHGTTGKSSRAVSALCLAEAGVEKAISELNSGSWAGTEELTTNLTMSIDGFETPGGAIVGDVDITVMPFNDADGTRIVESTGRVAHRGPSEVARTVKVLLLNHRPSPVAQPGEGSYIVKSWFELPAGF